MHTHMHTHMYRRGRPVSKGALPPPPPTIELEKYKKSSLENLGHNTHNVLVRNGTFP